MEDLSNSIESLRADLRRHKAMTAAAALIAVIALFVGLGRGEVSANNEDKPALDEQKQYDLLQAKRFELVGKGGGVVAALRTHDTTGRPIVALYDGKGFPRAFLTLNAEYHPVLSFQDDEERQRLRMYLNDDHAGRIDMLDGKGIGGLEIEAGARPYLVMRNGDKEPRVILASNDSGPLLGLKGKQQNEVRIGINEDESATMEIWDKEAKLLFKQPK